MLGKPRFKHGEEVVFSIENKDGIEQTFIGIIYIVDECGTFDNDADASYDIFVKEDGGDGILFKHITESSIKYKIDRMTDSLEDF